MNPILEITSQLDDCQIPYRVWKGLHKIEMALEGKADIDIYVPLKYQYSLFSTLETAGWKKFKAPLEFENISHWYYYDRVKYCFYHLHIYNVMRTGPSHTKNYLIQNLDIENRKFLNFKGLKIFQAAENLELHKARLKLKAKGFFSRILLFRERSKHLREQKILDKLIDPAKNQNHVSLLISKLETKRKFTQVRNLFKKVFSKLFKIRKRLTHGISISLIGSDGSGKSALSKKLLNLLRRNFEVRHLSFGRPQFYYQSAHLWCFRMFVQAMKPRKKLVGAVTKSKERSSYLEALYHLFVAIERFIVCHRASKMTKKGIIVIVDRCPSFQVGQMDSPKIVGQDGFIGLLSKIEKAVYRNMIKFDLSIRLHVSLEAIIERNRNRNKFGKETDEDIKERFDMFKNFRPESNDELSISGEGNLKETLANLTEQVFNRLPN